LSSKRSSNKSSKNPLDFFYFFFFFSLLLFPHLISIMLPWLVIGAFQLTYADVDYSCLHSASWVMNDKGDTNSHFNAETNVLSSKLSNGQWAITSYGIPNYDREFTTDDITDLNSRPKAASDFDGGQTSAVAGEEYSFGDDIGYTSTACTLGYWPPGNIVVLVTNACLIMNL
jgi:hypothetical protein